MRAGVFGTQRMTRWTPNCRFKVSMVTPAMIDMTRVSGPTNLRVGFDGAGKGLRLDRKNDDSTGPGSPGLMTRADSVEIAFEGWIEIRLDDGEGQAPALAHRFNPAAYEGAAHGAGADQCDGWGLECAHASPMVSNSAAPAASCAAMPARMRKWNAGLKRSEASKAAASIACTSPTEISSRPIIGMA